MDAYECSNVIRRAEKQIGQENIDAVEDVCNKSLRQLSVIYHLIHNRLDRPLVEDQYWPECLKLLKKELISAFGAQKIPESWLKVFLPGRKSEQERAARELYTSSLQPLLSAASDEVEKVLTNIREIESHANEYWSPYQKRRYIKSELNTLCRWALKLSWETYNALNLFTSRSKVSRARQEAGSRNNSSRKVALCAEF